MRLPGRLAGRGLLGHLCSLSVPPGIEEELDLASLGLYPALLCGFNCEAGCAGRPLLSWSLFSQLDAIGRKIQAGLIKAHRSHRYANAFC